MVKKQKKRPFNLFLIIALSTLALILIFFIFKIYLLANYLVGNDLIISLSSDKENIFLLANQSEKVTFEISAAANPFCSIFCNYSLYDLSDNYTLDSGNISMSSRNFQEKSYQLYSPKKGSGQKIYSFKVLCQSKKTAFCNTETTKRIRNVLITLDYNLSKEEEIERDLSAEKILLLKNYSDYLLYTYNYLDNLSLQINFTQDYLQFSSSLRNISDNLTKVNSYLINASYFWTMEDYSSLNSLLSSSEEDLSKIILSINSLNESLSSKFSLYVAILANISVIESNLKNLKNINMSLKSYNETNSAINEFNFAKNLSSSNLSSKENSLLQILNWTNNINLSLYNDSLSNVTLYSFPDAVITEFIYANISFPEFNYTQKSFSLEPQKASCCLYNSCSECLSNSNENYPIIFLHGHDFNEKVSADHSLDAFTFIQEGLEPEYLNAGSLIVAQQEQASFNSLGKISCPISVRASYYFDLFKTSEKITVLQTKTSNIDTYSIKLKDILEEVKFKSGKDKVIIIAHSMGGLVVRRYVQVFGDSSLSQIILIGTPNHGIDESTLSYCSLLGAKSECEDMDKSSLFINKLENAPKPNIPISVIIGTGCQTGNEDGDGIVKRSSAYLDYASNYYLPGNCSGFEYLHGKLLSPEASPEVLTTIKSILNISKR